MSEGVDMSVCECEVLLGRIPGPVSYLIYATYINILNICVYFMSSFKTFFLKKCKLGNFVLGAVLSLLGSSFDL